MKKLFLTVFFAGGIFLLLSQGEVLWSKLKFLDEPRIHKVRKGESLSKLAQRHYGDAQHWRELALVNRAPKPSHIQVGEEILLPSATVINELSRSRTLTRVNTLLGDQENAAERSAPESSTTVTKPTNGSHSVAPAEKPSETSDPSGGPVPETTPDPIAPQSDTTIENTGFPWFWLAIGMILIAGVVGFLLYRRKQEEEGKTEVETVESNRTVNDRSTRSAFTPFSKENRRPFGKPGREKENLAA
jgi:LPXTG-motif cell wall-anchored protein